MIGFDAENIAFAGTPQRTFDVADPALHILQIGAGAESASISGQHHCMHAFCFLRLIQG